MGLGQCISHSQGGEAPQNRNSHLRRRRDAWGVQGRWRGMASGRGARRPWLRSALSEGMQASRSSDSLVFWEKERTSLVWLFPFNHSLQANLPGAPCSLTYHLQNQKFSFLEVKLQFYTGRSSRAMALILGNQSRFLSCDPHRKRARVTSKVRNGKSHLSASPFPWTPSLVKLSLLHEQ